MALPVIAIAGRAVGGAARGAKVTQGKGFQATAGGGVTFKMDRNVELALKEFRGDWARKHGKDLFRIAEEAAGIIRETIATTWLSKSRWKLSTGTLMRSFRPTMLRAEGRSIMVGVYSNVVYAAIHETGGIIHPKSAQNLAIPLTRTARRVSPRAFPGKLFFVLTPLGNKILAIRLKTKIKPQYLLEDQVTIQPKKYLAISARKIEKILPARYHVSLTHNWNRVASKYSKPGKVT